MLYSFLREPARNYAERGWTVNVTVHKADALNAIATKHGNVTGA
jgi:hypothetical protein